MSSYFEDFKYLIGEVAASLVMVFIGPVAVIAVGIKRREHPLDVLLHVLGNWITCIYRPFRALYVVARVRYQVTYAKLKLNNETYQRWCRMRMHKIQKKLDAAISRALKQGGYNDSQV